MICEEMDYLGIEINNSQNEQRSDDILEISTTDSRVKVLVIPTNEELEIAKQAYDLSLEN
jgi:acetate kinase